MKATSAADARSLGTAEIGVELTTPFVATVELRRPPANYFDVPLLSGLGHVYRGLCARGDVRAIVLCSQGRHFCAGADFTGASGAEPIDADEGARALYAAGVDLFRAELPVVAAVQGAAIGGGLGLALTADFRVAEEGSRFAANFSRLGLHPGFGISVTLPRAVGHQVAADLLLTGRTMPADEALMAGLCDRLAPAGQVRAVAQSFAAELAAAAPLAVRSIRATLRGDLADQIAAIVDHERDQQSALRATHDFDEGIAASAQRRPPVFTGE